MAQRHDDEEKRAIVLGVYAATGNAKRGACDAGVPERTAQRWVAKAIKDRDPLLAELGAELRTRAVDTVTRLVLSGAEVAHARLHDEDWCRSFHSDPGPAYQKSLVDARKSLLADVAGESGDGSGAGAGVIINVYGPEGVEVADNGDAKPETG